MRRGHQVTLYADVDGCLVLSGVEKLWKDVKPVEALPPLILPDA
jgi:hypothetical protein